MQGQGCGNLRLTVVSSLQCQQPCQAQMPGVLYWVGWGISERVYGGPTIILLPRMLVSGLCQHP